MPTTRKRRAHALQSKVTPEARALFLKAVQLHEVAKSRKLTESERVELNQASKRFDKIVQLKPWWPSPIFVEVEICPLPYPEGSAYYVAWPKAWEMRQAILRELENSEKSQ